MSLVIDASVTIPWLFEDEATKETEALLETLREEPAFVPGLWLYEVANVLLAAERRGRVSEAQTHRLILALQDLPVVVVQPEPTAVFVEALNVGRRYGLTAYDSSYLELAMRKGCALATFDQQLRKAAEHVGVAVVP